MREVAALDDGCRDVVHEEVPVLSCDAAFVARPGVEWNDLVSRPDVWGNDLDDVATQIVERDL